MSDNYPLKSKTRAGVFFALAKDAARLMVGVGNYRNYCAHMAEVHPGIQPMTEVQYFRYCQEARYPGKSGSIHRCPC